MDLRELYYLNALAEEQSISKAAERLYIAQASLSQFLRQFEAQLGSPLFVRTNKGIRPTPSGKVFLSHAKHILKGTSRPSRSSGTTRTPSAAPCSSGSAPSAAAMSSRPS